MVRFKNRYLLIDIRAQPAESSGNLLTHAALHFSFIDSYL
jgi:hypothetical protein